MLVLPSWARAREERRGRGGEERARSGGGKVGDRMERKDKRHRS